MLPRRQERKNNMANTLLQSDVITRMINEAMTGKEKLMGLASDLGNLPNGVHAGNTFTIVKYQHLGEMVDLAKGDTIAIEDLVATESQETIEHKAKGFTIFDIEKETTIGGKSLLDNKISDMADIRIRAIEKSLGNKMAKAPLKYAVASATEVTEDEINNALQQAFGDDQDYDTFAGIVVNSKVATGFYTMNGFVSADLTHTQGGNGIVKGGIIGKFRGIDVIMSDVTTYDTTKNEALSFIVKKDAIGYKIQAGEVEVARSANKKADEVYDDIMFLTGVISEAGVCVLRKTIA